MSLGQQPLWRDVKALRVALGASGLGQPGGWLPFSPYASVPYNITATTVLFAATVSRAMTVRSLHLAVFVATTNNGTNYWTIELIRTSDSGVITSFTTAAIAADTWVVLSSTGLASAVTTAHLALSIKATKVLSPGAFYAAGPMVYVS